MIYLKGIEVDLPIEIYPKEKKVDLPERNISRSTQKENTDKDPWKS
jgi:hypothetical protein